MAWSAISSKLNLWEYSEFHIIETGSKYKYPIHRDTPFKLLSGVIYLSPKVNKGTILYEDKKGTNEKVIDWKQNRALFFSRKENNSYHSYEGDNISTRRALVYNLMTTNMRGVCKAEKTFYPYILFKQKINKYLLKYFNFTI